MKAYIVEEPGGSEVLKQVDVAVPQLNDGEVLIAVKAISINPVDVKSREGKGIYGRIKEETPLILGWDVSGIIKEVKGNVSGFKEGDEVFGMVNFPGHGKAYAEYVAAPADQLALKPSNISHEDAAASTLVGLTAWQVMVDHGKIKEGDKVLVHAASGGVGHFAVQLAKHLGAYVIGTSSAKNRDFVLSMGADEHIDYTSQNFEEIVSNADFVLDTLGNDNIAKSVSVTKDGGMVISIPSGVSDAVLGEAEARNIEAYFVLVQSDGEDMKAIADLLEADKIKMHVSKKYSFDQMAEAHNQIASGRTVGKIVITL